MNILWANLIRQKYKIKEKKIKKCSICGKINITNRNICNKCYWKFP